VRFQGKVALVTGGGQGIGRATAIRFAEEGASVVVGDRNGTDAEAVAQEIQILGHEALAIVADVADEIQSQQMAAKITEGFGQLDVVFANAGISHHHQIGEMPVEIWDEVIRVNLRAFSSPANTPSRHSSIQVVVLSSRWLLQWPVGIPCQKEPPTWPARRA
jgi:3-oxoacyl-[acyl-carrier protein] reductase